MLIRRALPTLRVLAIASTLALAGGIPATLGCSHGRVATITAGPMPEGQEWTGVYYNPVYGYAHILERDGKVWGRYKWANQSHWGEINGTIDGDVVHFEYVEYDVNPVAPGESRRGRGYWVYKVNKDNIGALKGEYGLDDNETGGGEWDALKMKNMKPDPDSVKADVKADVPATGDTWDQGSQADAGPAAPGSSPEDLNPN